MNLCRDCKHCTMVSYAERAALMGTSFHTDAADLFEGHTFALCARGVTIEKSLVDGRFAPKGIYRDCEHERNPSHPFGRFCGEQGKYWEPKQ